MAHILQGYIFLLLSFSSRWAAWSVLQCRLGEGAELGGPALTGEQRKAADNVQSLVTVQVSQGPGAALESRLLIWRDRQHRGWTMRIWWHGCFKDHLRRLRCWNMPLSGMETQSYAAYLGMLMEDMSSHDAPDDHKLFVHHTEWCFYTEGLKKKILWINYMMVLPVNQSIFSDCQLLSLVLYRTQS